MRELIEEVHAYYFLNEALSKEPSSPITTQKIPSGNNELNINTNTQHTQYQSVRSQSNSKIAKDQSDIAHHVSWKNVIPSDNMNNTQKKNTLHDAMHLHNDYIKSHTNVGDLVTNNPTKTGDKTSRNRREEIYSKAAGFGALSNSNRRTQYGIVRQHPDDHEDESKRGQKYLHPIEHHEIEAYHEKNRLIGNLKANNTPEKREEGLSKIKQSIENTNDARRRTGRVTVADLKAKTGTDKNHLEMAQRSRNMKKSELGKELHPISRMV